MTANPSERWPTHAPAEALVYGDRYIEATAEAYDTILSGLGDVLRAAWHEIRPQPTCDCPLDPYHRWNCSLTPVWAQTIRELDVNPWTVVQDAMPQCRSFGCGSPLGHAGDHDPGSLREQIARQNAKNAALPVNREDQPQ